MLLSVIIVNYNTGGYLRDCLDSIEGGFSDIPYEVVVVDNASSDGSEEAAMGRRHVILARSEHNLGFGAACNRGALLSSGDLYLFLNPDTRILSSDIAALVGRFVENGEAGALGCQNRLPDGSVQTSAYTFPTLFQVASFVFGLKNLLRVPLLKKLLAPFLKGRFGQFHPHDRYRIVDYVTGAFMLVKKEAWLKVGGFDERFFLFCEEIDWCLRLKNSGMTVVFDPSFEIEHYVGYSSGKVKPRVLLEKYRSYTIYFGKHHSPLSNFCLKMIVMTGIRFWMTYYFFTGDKESRDAYGTVRKQLGI